MGWLDRLFGRREEPPKKEDAKAAAAAGFERLLKTYRLSEAIFANPDQGTAYDDIFYKQLGGGTMLDLPPEMVQRSQRLALLLYRKNVRAFCATELVKDFCIGEGISVSAADPRVQKVIDEHNQVNRWGSKLPERFRSLSLFGEQVYPTFVNEKSGLVRISSITPLRVVDVIRDGDNAEETVGIDMMVGGPETPGLYPGTGYSGEQTRYATIEYGRPMAEIGQQGEAFFFAINRVAGATRGMSDLMPAIDWLEGLDGLVFSLLERAELSNDIVFDLTYEGLNDKELSKKAAGFMRSLSAGEAFAHNEKVKLNILSPDLKGSDAKEVTSILLRQIQSGTRLAGLFFGDSEDLTRASASELSIPVAKAIQARQNFVKSMMTEIYLYQIGKSKDAGRLRGVEDFTFEVDMPRVWLRDLTTITQPLNELADALGKFVQAGHIKPDEAAAISRSAIEHLGPMPTLPASSTKDEEDVEEIYSSSAGGGYFSDVAETAYNGAQISAVADILKQVSLQVIPRESGASIISRMLKIPMNEAWEMIGPAGNEDQFAPKRTEPVVKGEIDAEATDKGKDAEAKISKPEGEGSKE